MKRKLLVLIGILVAVAAACLVVSDRTGFLERLETALMTQMFGGGAEDSGQSMQTEQVSRMQELQTLEAQTTETLSPEMMVLQEKNEKRLVDGCLAGKDCVPSIDNPKFVAAGRYSPVSGDEDVVGVFYGGEARAYPVKILNFHEIVNDRIGGRAITVTYCPLSGTAAVFEGDMKGDGAGFGVSGKLLNSNLVLYDRSTDSLWSQMTGEALTGPQTGSVLKSVPVQVMSYTKWLARYPGTKVLSARTGFNHSYDDYPYGDYRDHPAVYFPLEHEDGRLQPKTSMFGVDMAGAQKAYPVEELRKALPKGGFLEDKIGNNDVIVTYREGFFDLKDLQTKSPVAFRPAYWFAWAAFNPQTEVFKAEVK